MQSLQGASARRYVAQEPADTVGSASLQKPFAECDCPFLPWIAELLRLHVTTDMRSLSANPHHGAISLLRSGSVGVYTTLLARNPHPWAVARLLADNLVSQNNHGHIFANPNAAIIRQLPVTFKCRLWWTCTNKSPVAIRRIIAPLLSRQLTDDHWEVLSSNPCQEAVDFMREQHPHRIKWSALCSNSNPVAVEMLRAHPDRIDWSMLSFNCSEWAVALLLANPDKIDWCHLCANTHPAAVDLLRLRPTWIYWHYFLQNPAIFADEYHDVARQYFREHVAAQLMAVVWHPRNIARFPGLGMDI